MADKSKLSEHKLTKKQKEKLGKIYKELEENPDLLPWVEATIKSYNRNIKES
ncbi:hypothetical protein [Leptospira sarikeiensis]|uniref:hypothetical protein n=1 Tax=Leptospira sarikeiensis TaxID=2484943 RepID=UPI0014385F15|nr:hypothetical protein [Leptospira sarikeiensis]